MWLSGFLQKLCSPTSSCLCLWGFWSLQLWHFFPDAVFATLPLYFSPVPVWQSGETNITQVVVVMVSKTKSMSKILLIYTFVALGNVTKLPSFPLIHGVAPDSRLLVRISTKVVLAKFFEPVPVRLLFRPLLANPSRNRPCDASLIIFASCAIRTHILTFWWNKFLMRQYLEIKSLCHRVKKFECNQASMNKAKIRSIKNIEFAFRVLNQKSF